MMKKTILLTLAFLAALAGQGQPQPPRKKVAVVLSGGGAKGMAHIGALKVIERAGIPVDIITGTSMGSIVGGLYAIGYNAGLLDSLVRRQDWSYLLSDREDMSQQSLADRQKQNTYILSRGLAWGKRSLGDGGLIQGKNLATLFQTLCEGYLDSLDFNQLPIPFACVATDIINNTEYDFHAGHLPQAMRASMSIPAAFSPVRVGEKVLVDGGLRNNYPADLAREMGADVIIGVTVQGAPKTADDLGNTMSILSQIIDVNCKNKYEENLQMTDVPIRVNTTGFNAASFTPQAIDTLIRRGEEEALKHWDELLSLKQQLGLSSDYRAPLLHPSHSTAETRPVRITSVVFENMTPDDERFIRDKFRLDRAEDIDAGSIENMATAIRTDLFYQSVATRREPDGHGGCQLTFTAGNRKTSQVNLGIRFDTEEKVALQLNADIPLKTRLPMDADFTMRLGKRMMGKAELTFHPRSITRPTLAYTFRRNDMDIYNRGHRDYSTTYNHHRAALTPVNLNVRNFNVRMGLQWDYYHYHDKLLAAGTLPAEVKNDHYLSYRAQVDYNSENNWNFPTRGARFKAVYAYITDNLTQLDGQSGLSDVSAHWRMAFALNSRFALQPLLYGRMLFGKTVPVPFANVLGSEWFGHYVDQQMPFAGVGNVEYTSRHFIACQLQGQQRIATNNFVQLRLAVGQHAPQLSELTDHHTLLGCQVAYYYNTILGPVGATLGYATKTEKPYLYINLGFEF